MASNKNVDIINNANIGHRNLSHLHLKSSKHPTVKIVGADKLTITFSSPRRDSDQLEQAIAEIRKPDHGRFRLVRSYPDRSPYAHRDILKDQNGKHLCLIEHTPRKAYVHDIRLEFNPARVGEDGMKTIRIVLRHVLGKDYKRNILAGNITRIDGAVDICKASANDLLICTDHHRESSLWVRNFNRDGVETWATETTALGSVHSDYYVSKYDKSAQLWRIWNKILDHLRTRIEIRYHPRDCRNRYLRVKDLWQANNPFNRLRVIYLPGFDDPDPFFNLVVYASRSAGLEAALGLITDRNKRSRYRKHLVQHLPDWWNPEAFWEGVINSLKATQLFLPEAFDSNPITPIKHF